MAITKMIKEICHNFIGMVFSRIKFSNILVMYKQAIEKMVMPIVNKMDNEM